MDPYDAIREQLKSAQSNALETLMERLVSAVDAFEQARTALEGVIPQQADEVFPLADVEASLSELADSVAVGGSGAVSGITVDVIRRLDAARSQSDLLHELMGILSGSAARSAVLVFRDQLVSAWSGVGFSEGSNLQTWQGDVGESPLFLRFVNDPRPVGFSPADDPLLGEWMAAEAQASEALLVPVTLRGKLMGAIYADRLGSAAWSPDDVQALVAMGCWLIDNLHHRSLAPSAMLAEVVSTDQMAAPPAGAEVAAVEPETPVVDFEVSPAEAETPVPDFEEIPVEPEPELVEPEPAAVDFEVTPVSDEMLAAEPVIEEPAEAVEEIEVAEPVSGFQEAEEFELGETPEPDFDMGGSDDAGTPQFEDEGDIDPGATVQVDLGSVDVPAIEEPEMTAGDFELDDSAVEAAPAIEELPEVEAVPPPPADMAAEASAVVPPPEAAAEVKPVAPPPDMTAEVQPVIPPSDMVESAEPEAAEAAPQMLPEDETRHEEARRFARLLVSEIKLYNEEDVDKGRANHDLYQRLKDDIDRSREMYEKRIPPDIRASRDYFHEELVRILADGDPDSLGM